MNSETITCEMCGTQIPRNQAKTVYVEGTVLWVCSLCYSKLSRSRSSISISKQSASSQTAINISARRPQYSQLYTRGTGRSVGTTRKKSQDLVKYELVEDYAQRIKSARERLGWSISMLAEKVKESVTTIKRIESGKLRPTIDLARRLEEVLKIKLLVPSVEEELRSSETQTKRYVTLGEIVAIRGAEQDNE